MKETARRPADAYPAMARLLGDDFFLRWPPTENFVHMVVQGRDGIATHWDIPRAKWASMFPLMRFEGLTILSVTPR